MTCNQSPALFVDDKRIGTSISAAVEMKIGNWPEDGAQSLDNDFSTLDGAKNHIGIPV